MLNRSKASAAPGPPAASRQTIPSIFSFFRIRSEIWSNALRQSPLSSRIFVSFSAGKFFSASATPARRSSRLRCPGIVITTMFPFGASAAIRLTLSLPARTLSVPIYSSLFDSGTSASTQITGTPAATALSMSARKKSVRAAERQIPEGCFSMRSRNMVASAPGS